MHHNVSDSRKDVPYKDTKQRSKRTREQDRIGRRGGGQLKAGSSSDAGSVGKKQIVPRSFHAFLFNRTRIPLS